MADDAATPSGKHATTAAEPTVTLSEPESTAIEATDTVVVSTTKVPRKRNSSHVRLAIVFGVVAVLVLGGLTGWLGYGVYQDRQLDHQRQVFLQVGRQGALNLTTLNFETIDADVARILDSATGSFYDDFQQRSESFGEVVKQVKSKSEGSVTEAALVDPTTPTEAQVLVAVTVNSQIQGQPEQPPRSWRMRISVQKVGDETKVSNVEFVP